MGNSSGETRVIKQSKNVEHHFNSDLVHMFISLYESKKYVEFIELLPKKGKMNFLRDYYKINIKENKTHNTQYYLMYCEFSVENN